MFHFFCFSSLFKSSISFCIAHSSGRHDCTGRTFSCSHWNTTNSAGTTNSKASVPISIPPTALEPSVRLPLAPTPGGHHHREKAENHCQGGHQYGAQTYPRRTYRCLRQRHASLTALHGVFCNQNGGLCQQADKHDKPRLHIDVVFQSQHLGEQEAAEHAERKGKHHGERYQETFVERTQDEIDQHETDGEDDDGVAA